MTEPTTPPLRVVDALQELTAVPAIAPEIHAPRPALAASIEAVLERLTSWSADFAEGSAPATVKAVRSDWAQYLVWCEASGATPLPASVDQLETFLSTAIDKGRKRATVDRYLYTRFGRDSGNFRKMDHKPLRLQGKFDVFRHGTLVPIQVQRVMA
jgi:hypothetical protein